MSRRRPVLVAAVVMIMAGASAAVVGMRGLDDERTQQAKFEAPQPATRTELGRDAQGRRYLEILGAGDVLAHPELWRQAVQDGHGEPDYYPMFGHAAPTIAAADLAVCHLETPLAPVDGPFDGFPRFSVPPQIVSGIKRAGFDACSTASNHAIDQGEAGIARTIDELDRHGIGHSGTYLTQPASITPVLYDVKGIKVGHLSYTKHFNGLTPPDGKAWIANPIDVASIRTAAAAARAAGAKIVVLSMHWGTEYQHEPDSDQQTWAQEVIAIPNIDVVFGHHAHVVQPVENVNGKWIIYGLGNQIARHLEPIDENREGAMVRVRFTEQAAGTWQVSNVEAIPTWVDLNPDIRLIDLAVAIADPATPESKRVIYRAALQRIAGHLNTRGAVPAGMKIAGSTDGT